MNIEDPPTRRISKELSAPLTLNAIYDACEEKFRGECVAFCYNKEEWGEESAWAQPLDIPKTKYMREMWLKSNNADLFYEINIYRVIDISNT